MSNVVGCDYIISDTLLELHNNESVKEINFYDCVLFVYKCRQEVNGCVDGKYYVYYTSGSTGIPKAFIKTELAIYEEGLAIANELEMKREDCILSVVPCSHVFGQSVVCVAAALIGAKVVYSSALTSPTSLVNYINEGRFKHVVAAPFYFEFLCENEDELNHECQYISGGASLSEKVRKSNLKVINFYGSTETGVVAINKGDTREHYAGKLVNGVRVFYGNEIKGVRKEAYSLIVESAFCASETFTIGHVTSKCGRCIPLNDYGILANDGVYVYGRIDNILNINGLKVSSIEIEKVILEHKDVKEVKVVKKKDEVREYMQAYVVEREKGILNSKVIIDFCINRLERYKVPSKIEIVDKLAYTELGKVIIG